MQFLPGGRVGIDSEKVREALVGFVFHDQNAVFLRDADVIPSLGLHLRQDFRFRRAKINIEGVPRLHVDIPESGNASETGNESRQTLPAWFYAEMGDSERLGLALVIDCFK